MHDRGRSTPLRLKSLAFSLVIAGGALIAPGGCGQGLKTDVSMVEGSFLQAWSPNSELLATADRQRVVLRGPGGSSSEVATTTKPAKRGAIGWSSDGSDVHYLAKAATGESGISAVVMRPSGQPLQRIPLHASVLGADWAQGGWPLVYVTSLTTFEPGNRRLGPTPDLWILAGPEAQPRRLLKSEGVESGPGISRDGKKVLFTLDEGTSTSIWTVSSDGSDARKLVGGLVDGLAAWSPDGTQVAVAATTAAGDRRCHLYVIPAAGGPLRQVSNEEILGDPPAWTPDGLWLTYSTYDSEVKRVHADGSSAEVIAEYADHEIRDFAWSPDGAHLAFTAEPFPDDS